VVAVVAVFLCVPRAVSIDTISVHSTKMTLNATTLTIRIILVARIPLQNANYMHVSPAAAAAACKMTAALSEPGVKGPSNKTLCKNPLQNANHMHVRHNRGFQQVRHPGITASGSGSNSACAAVSRDWLGALR
jgi:hypothetical protein